MLLSETEARDLLEIAWLNGNNVQRNYIVGVQEIILYVSKLRIYVYTQ